MYEEANFEVAILCNHQKAISKTFNESLEKMKDKLAELKSKLQDAIKAKKDKKVIENARSKVHRMEKKIKSKIKFKSIATGTSKLNYNDPRITGRENNFFFFLIYKFIWE